MTENIYSFDIFDTILVRIWAEPTDLFWELGNQLHQEGLISISADQWMEFRIKAEKDARQTPSAVEVTLKEIYEKLRHNFSWSINDCETAILKEIHLESVSLRPVPEISNMIKTLRQKSKQIIYISDMYLPKESVKYFLEKNGIWSDNDILFLSSEIGSMKANGNLFHKVLLSESIQRNQLNHIGDNFHSDFKIPKKFGIKAQHYKKTHINRYEKEISEAINIPLKFRSLFAGASRLTRLRCTEDSFHEQVIWDTSANIIAPVLFGFVYWCLEEAENKGIKRLYFVARDGQILLKIAEIICQNWGYTIDCRYLYGSRQAWHFPAIEIISEDELNWIFDSTQFLSVESVCERVNITPDKIKHFLISHGFPEKMWSYNLNGYQRDLLRSIFQEPSIKDIIIPLAKDYREKTFEYFKQEGLCDTSPFAIVDIGWNGRLQRSLSKILDFFGFRPHSGIQGFYFALSNRLKAFENDQLFAYFSDFEFPSHRDNLCHVRGLFEIFVSADHGGTIRFKQDNNKYVPVLRSEINEKAINWGLMIQHGSVLEFTEQFTSNYNNLSQKCQYNWFLIVAEILLRKFILSPSFKEAEVYGRFEISEDQSENIFYLLSPKYGFNECMKFLLYNTNLHHNVWLKGSISRSDFFVKLFFKIGTNNFVRKILLLTGIVLQNIRIYKISFIR